MNARQTHIDALKLIGAQLIVLHHLSAYGPVADAVSQAAPGLVRWLYDYARMAVQVFLVLGGYLAVQSLEPAVRQPGASFTRTLLRRYQRLVGPFLVALLLAVAGAALARQWMNADFIPAIPTWGQALAHALLLHDVLGHEALSAGVWYVAIDFQLFALMALLLWLGYKAGQVQRLAQALVLGLMLVSLFFFNRDADWDNWAPYFFGSYGMGAAACWAGRSHRPGMWLGMLTLVGLLALAIDWRERIALALTVALLLGLAHWHQHTQKTALVVLPEWLAQSFMALGKTSYALFLVHFPVLMLGNALFVRFDMNSSRAGAAMLLGIWVASLVLAFGFERWIEAPLARLIKPSRSPRPAR